MKYDKILIDTSNFFQRAYYVACNETSLNNIVKYNNVGNVLQGVFPILLRMIDSIKKEFAHGETLLYFLFDNYYSKIFIRKEIDPDYKANREKSDEIKRRSLELFNLMLLYANDNYFCIKKEGAEADDLVKPLIDNFEKHEKILLISNDKDWFRAIKDNVHVGKYENGKYVIYDKVEFYSKYGFEITETSFVMYKTFKGDAADNIVPGIEKFKTKLLQKICIDYDSIEHLLDNLDDNQYISDYYKAQILDNKARLLLNITMLEMSYKVYFLFF